MREHIAGDDRVAIVSTTHQAELIDRGDVEESYVKTVAEG